MSSDINKFKSKDKELSLYDFYNSIKVEKQQNPLREITNNKLKSLNCFYSNKINDLNQKLNISKFSQNKLSNDKNFFRKVQNSYKDFRNNGENREYRENPIFLKKENIKFTNTNNLNNSSMINNSLLQENNRIKTNGFNSKVDENHFIKINQKPNTSYNQLKPLKLKTNIIEKNLDLNCKIFKIGEKSSLGLINRTMDLNRTFHVNSKPKYNPLLD